MGKRGIALVLALFVITIIAGLSGSFFLKSVNENSLVRRAVNSTRAFWLAEAGIAEVLANMPNNASGTIGSGNYAYSAVCAPLTGDYYQVDSTGTVTLPNSDTVTRSLNAVVRTDPVDASNFQHAIRTTVELIVRGSVDINGPSEEFASLNFPDLFEHSKEEIESYATHVYTDPPVDVAPVDTITWVNLSEGEELRISSDTWSGSGILVVEGDAQITGGTFSGIIYIMGELRMSGNPVINGTILAESSAELDTTLTGNVTINYDVQAIADALEALQFISPEIVSWRET